LYSPFCGVAATKIELPVKTTLRSNLFEVNKVQDMFVHCPEVLFVRHHVLSTERPISSHGTLTPHRFPRYDERFRNDSHDAS